MATSLYLGLGVLDAIAEIALILKLYRLPFVRFRYRIVLFAIGIAILSYFMRMVFELPLLDLPLQYFLFILFFRFALNIKVHLASFIIGVGITIYTLIQLGIYYIGTYIDHWGSDYLLVNDSIYVQIIQFSSDSLVLLASFILYKFNLGFSFIKEPPHDFFLKEDYLSRRNLVIVTSSLISALSISSTLLFLYRANIFKLTILTIVVLCISYYFSRRRDYDDIRTTINAYSNKNQDDRS
ncbi:Uncharacterised protein [Mycobacterium tuberculosis]|nr:Uncharacterised protein [Mycobacterium tuberculosis]